MNIVDCSAVNITFCSKLNRSPCTSTANTCGSCYTDYVGKVGDANAFCFPSSEPGKGIGATCSKASECLYGTCMDGICVAPTQSCLMFNNQECGGHGICQYLIGGIAVAASKCSILDTACVAVCKCSGGYGGKDCSLDSNTLTQREGARMTMCETLTNATASSDTSIALIDSLSSSILSAYDQYEVITEVGIYSCASSLNSIVSAMFEGNYLDMTSSSTSAQNLVETISEFVVAGNASFLQNITSSLVQTALYTMAKGQTSVELTSDNLKLKLSRDLSSSLSNISISSPITKSEKSYGAQPVSIALTGNNQFMCDDGSGYVSLSVGLWSYSPFANSTELTTPLFRSESMVRSGNIFLGSTISDEIAYYLVFPFNQAQSLSSLTAEEKSLMDSYNETLPSCTKYNEKNELVPCNSCNVSTFSNISVTFACYDLAEFCKSTSTLQTQTVEDEDDNIQEKMAEDIASLVYQTAALVTRIEHSIVTTISFNVFSINLQRSKVVLSFVGTLFFTFVVGLCFFYRWDRQDRTKLLYVKKAKRINAVPGMSKKMRANMVKDQSVQLYNDLLEFVQNAIPLKIANIQDTKDVRKSLYYYFIKPLVDNHEYLLMFGKSSLSNTRLLRWVYLCQQLFFALFIDTLFFSIFFADDGTCESFQSEESCTMGMNSITGQSTCLWSESTPSRGTYEYTCSLNPPPDDIVFVVMLSAVTILLTVPLATIFDYVTVEICAKRPDFKVFGWNNFYWVGGSSDLSTVNEAHRKLQSKLLSKEEQELVAKRLYLDASPVTEEACIVLKMWVNEIKCPKEEFLSVFDVAALGKVVKQFTGLSLDYWIADGQPSPTEYRMAHRRLLSASRQSNKILEQLSQSADDELVDIDKEVLQFFILENLPAYQRFVLKSQCFVHQHISPPPIDGRLWIVGWMFMIGSVLFFNYWVLTWILSSGSQAFAAWAANYGVGVLQEVIMIQFFKVYFLYIATMASIVPRLQAIQSVLNNILMDISRRHHKQGVASTETIEFVASSCRSTYSLVQHFSPTCRAARSKLLANRLSGWLLIQLSDIDVYKVQNPLYKLDLGAFTIAILAIPVLVATVVSESMADSVFEQLFPTIMTSVFVGFCVLLAHSWQLFVIVLIVVVIIASFRSFMTSIEVHYKLWNNRMNSLPHIRHDHIDDIKLPLSLVSQHKEVRKKRRFSWEHIFYYWMNRVVVSLYAYIIRVIQQMIEGNDMKTQRIWRGMNCVPQNGMRAISSPFTSMRLESASDMLSSDLLTKLPLTNNHCGTVQGTIESGTYIDRTMSNQLTLIPNLVMTNSFIVLGVMKLERNSAARYFHFNIATKKDLNRYRHYIQCFHTAQSDDWTRVAITDDTLKVDATMDTTIARSRVASYDLHHRESWSTIDLIIRSLIVHSASTQESPNGLTLKKLVELLPSIYQYLSITQSRSKMISSAHVYYDRIPLYENNKRQMIALHLNQVFLTEKECMSIMKCVQTFYNFHDHDCTYEYGRCVTESYAKVDLESARKRKIVEYKCEVEEMLTEWLSINKERLKIPKCRRYSPKVTSLAKLDDQGSILVPLNQFILWLECLLVYQKRILLNIDATIMNKEEVNKTTN